MEELATTAAARGPVQLLLLLKVVLMPLLAVLQLSFL
jgi:hypothetical protein